LKTRREFLADRAHVKQTENCLDELEKDEVPLKILRAVEHGASGMEGPWGQSGSVSKMTVALLSNNMADKPLMAGGGYGQGKSVLPLISRIRTVLAYTCFPAGKICDLGMSIPSSRRLLGIAYWPEHTFEGEKTTGYGWLHAGENTDEENSALPWVDDAADLMAGSLGIEPRLPDTAEDSGTTFMILDPNINADELKMAIERYWWPAITEGKLAVSISDYEGTEETVKPSENEYLKPFIWSYNELGLHSEPSVTGYACPANGVQHLNGIVSGEISLTPAIARSGDPEKKSITALMRNLGMVVHYQQKSYRPAVFGVFKANTESEEIQVSLAKSEPKSHHRWNQVVTEGSDQVVQEINTLVANIGFSIRAAIKKYAEYLAPEQPQDSVTIPLPKWMTAGTDTDFDRFFKVDQRPSSLERKEVGVSKLKLNGSIAFTPKKHEDEGAYGKWCALRLRLDVKGGSSLPVDISGLDPDAVRWHPGGVSTKGVPVDLNKGLKSFSAFNKVFELKGTFLVKEKEGKPTLVEIAENQGTNDHILIYKHDYEEFEIKWSVKPYSRLFKVDLITEIFPLSESSLALIDFEGLVS
jgi:hypothetical protein